MVWCASCWLTCLLRRRRCRPASTRSGAAVCRRAARSRYIRYSCVICHLFTETRDCLSVSNIYNKYNINLTMKSSGEIQLSPSATPAHRKKKRGFSFNSMRTHQLHAPQMQPATSIYSRLRTSERDVELAGADGPGDGHAERGGVLAAVGLGDQEQRAGRQGGHLLHQRPDHRGHVLRLLPVAGHQQTVVLHVAVPCAHRVVLPYVRPP